MPDETLYTVNWHDEAYRFIDAAVSCSAGHIFHEVVKDSYGLSVLRFGPGEVILDIGANVGIISVFLAHQWPETRIIAYEPLPENYIRLLRNLELNGVANVTAINKAVTGDGRPVTLRWNPDNMGGATAWGGCERDNTVTVRSVTLDDVFKAHNIDRLALLKMDCEGEEWAILQASGHLFDRIAALAMELHDNDRIRAQGYPPMLDILGTLAGRARVTTMEMAAWQM